MRARPLLLILTAAILASPLVGQAARKPRDLTIRDLFALDYTMVFPFEDPKSWLDNAHYLVFDGGKPDVQDNKQWFAVDAKTGQRLPLYDRATVTRELAAQKDLDAEAVAKALDDDDKYHWNETHTACVLAAGGELFKIAADSHVARLTTLPGEKVGEQFSPDGKWVAFVHDYDLKIVPANGGDVRALTEKGSADLLHGRLDWVYQEEVYGRGNFQGYWWSPDSSQLAVLELDESPVQAFTIVPSEPARPKPEQTKYPKTGEANPKARLGLVAAAGGPVRWFDLAQYPDDDRLIVRVTWAPDSREVFFQVQNRAQTWLDLEAGDVISGGTRRVFREDSDCWVEAGPEPKFSADGQQFVWPSERTGHRHLYRYGRDGALLSAITQGDWQVKEVKALDASGTIWFTGDKSSPLQTHLYRVPFAGGEVKAVTSGRGTHDVTMSPDCAQFVSRWSSVTTPQTVRLYTADGSIARTIAAPRTELLTPFVLADPEFVQLKARDGAPLEAMLLKPRGYEAGKRYPVVQHTYSGPNSPKVHDEWGSRDYLWHQLLSQKGYLVFLCDNRSASGKGRAATKACWKNLGASELADLQDGVHWLVEQGLADPARVLIWGWSYGGYQTLFNLTHSKVWKAGIAVNAVSDWRNYDTIYTERYAGLLRENASAYKRSSPVAAADQLHGRLLLICAAMDDNVHMQNSLQFLAALQQAGKDCDFMVYPGVRHGIEDLPQQLHLFARMTRFVEQNL
jgi:dipeptidyl-peptidase-4